MEARVYPLEALSSVNAFFHSLGSSVGKYLVRQVILQIKRPLLVRHYFHLLILTIFTDNDMQELSTSLSTRVYVVLFQLIILQIPV